LALLGTLPARGQTLDSLLNAANGIGDEIIYEQATFQTTRLVNGHSVEQDAKGVLNFRISHRFGPPSPGRPAYNLFGLDEANIRIAFEYGLTDKVMVGVGRCKDPGKAFDGFAKARILHQCRGGKNMPISLSYFASISVKTGDPALLGWIPNVSYPKWARVAYAHQVLLARKFSERLSLQLAPTLVHRNMVRGRSEANDVWACGMGGRYMVSPSTSLNFEYFYLLPNQLAPGFSAPYALGVDIETGGHVFQLHLTNSIGMTEPAFITETAIPVKATGIRFGFNLSRVFNVNT
jgi:hypothetical protein